MGAYVPRQGDLIILTFDPQAGHEQTGRRPALVVSVEPFNAATRLAMCCPITNTHRDIPFHVPVPPGLGLTGYVMCEQVKSLDYRIRRARFVDSAPRELIEEVLAMIDAAIFP